MPVARRYGQQQIRPAPIPSARRRAAPTAESLGADLERERARTAEVTAGVFAQGAGIALDRANQIVQRERQRADDVATMEAENALAEWEHENEAQVYARKGKNALGLPEEGRAAFDKRADEIAAGLTTDEQKLRFQGIRLRRGSNLAIKLQRYTVDQIDAYEAAELQKTIQTSKQDAIATANPKDFGGSLADMGRVVKQAMDRGLSAIQASGERLGLGPEAIEAEAREYKSSIHLGIIQRLISSEQLKAAEIYYSITKEQIFGAARGQIEESLEQQTGLAQSQQATAQILAMRDKDGKPLTLTQQRDKAKELLADEPKVLRETLSQLDHEDQVRDRQERLEAETFMRDALNFLDSTPDITPDITKIQRMEGWRKLNENQRQNLRLYAAERIQPSGKYDAELYYSLLDAAMDPNTRGDFGNENLYDYKARLGPKFDELLKIQMRIRHEKPEEANRELAGFRTAQQVFEDTVAMVYGKKSSDLPADKMAALRMELDGMVSAWEQSTGKKADSEVIQQQANSMFTSVIIQRGSWWSALPGGAPFSDVVMPLREATIDKIAPHELTFIRQEFAKQGILRPTNEQILQSWRIYKTLIGDVRGGVRR